jgi:hypothetical protein
MMEPLLVNLNKRLNQLTEEVGGMKKQIELVCCLRHDERVEAAYDAVERVDRLMKKLQKISEELAQEEKSTLAQEYQYYFGSDRDNPYD